LVSNAMSEPRPQCAERTARQSGVDRLRHYRVV
jgi:hypothetical protein